MAIEPRVRGCSLRVRDKLIGTEIQRYDFTPRVVNLWNSLPRMLVKFKSLTIFPEGGGIGRIKFVVMKRCEGNIGTGFYIWMLNYDELYSYT